MLQRKVTRYRIKIMIIKYRSVMFDIRYLIFDSDIKAGTNCRVHVPTRDSVAVLEALWYLTIIDIEGVLHSGVL